jgi:HEAT repeat protein
VRRRTAGPWLLSVLALILAGPGVALAAGADPFSAQVAAKVALLGSPAAQDRARAAEALGFLRAYSAEESLLQSLRADADASVRRAAALSLGVCGGRGAVPGLLAALNDPDFATAQGACVALSNITGMVFPFDATASAEARAAQVKVWRDWWATVPAEDAPPEVLQLLKGGKNLARGCPVTASTVYKGPPDLLTDGKTAGPYFQTKNVPFPQWCTVDLGKPAMISQVTVVQQNNDMVLTDASISVSLDDKTYKEVLRKKGRSPLLLEFIFPPCEARYVRLTSYNSGNPTYPCTLWEIEVSIGAQEQQERGIRALGALQGPGAEDAIYQMMGPLQARPSEVTTAQRPVVVAALRAIGRLGGEQSLTFLIPWLWETYFARYAADALGDAGDPRAIAPLVAAYPRYAQGPRMEDPWQAPSEDRPGFLAEDRAYETPFAIAFALARLPFRDEHDRNAVASIAPALLASLPQDYDGAVVYEPEVIGQVTGYLLDQCGLRQEACEAAFAMLGQPRRVKPPKAAPKLIPRNIQHAACWLSSLCRDREDLPRLTALLEHPDGWVRINAAKSLGFLKDERAVAPLEKLLSEAKSEAQWGLDATFKHDEYADPTPRFREAWVRALGMLGGAPQVPLIRRVMEDDETTMEVRYAAALALAQMGSDAALEALWQAATGNPFEVVRGAAREALWANRKGLPGMAGTPPPLTPAPGGPSPAYPEALVFIKGENAMPNDEQSDIWRQAYVTTDSGPTYRPGRNLYVLRPVRPDGTVTPLTTYADGYVADTEVSWDGKRVLFCRREQANPWWHIFEINADGTGLRQLTNGPFHDVCPAYLPDGRIVFTSSRIGLRDEYHGYQANALYVMNPDGSDIHAISINAGRDNEPAVLPDGRIVFARLEVFYSRLKTELTLHAICPDGTRDVVLYGPERRDFWHRLDVGPKGGDDTSVVYPMHRVLRMSQPQGLPGEQVVCATPGGLTIVGPGREQEWIIPHDKNRAFTTPFPLPDGRILCASTLKGATKPECDLGLYAVDPQSGEMSLVYNDPAEADYEARPLMPRPTPPLLQETAARSGFTGRFLCVSAFDSQEVRVPQRGRLVRVVEGQPVPARHTTSYNKGIVWRNHVGTLARVLGTVPLAADGSFFVEVPADRLLHFQVLDSDQRVVGNQLTWIGTRPDETRSCIGCHEPRDKTPPGTRRAFAAKLDPAPCLPAGETFRYRAKVWLKGSLPDEAEARTRTVQAINLMGR